MRRNEGIIVSVRLPKAVVQYIDDQVDTGMFTSRSDCIQQILREWIRYPRGGGKPDKLIPFTIFSIFFPYF